MLIAFFFMYGSVDYRALPVLARSCPSGRTSDLASAKGLIIGDDIVDSLMQPSEKQMREDLIAAAINDARAKADLAANEAMSKMTSGIPLPPGFKLPF